VTDSFWSAIDDLESQGASYHDVDLPSVEHAVEAYYVIAMSEASSNLARFDGVRYGYSSDSDGNWNEAFAETREEGFGEGGQAPRRPRDVRSLGGLPRQITTNRPRTPAPGSNRTSTSPSPTRDVPAAPTMPVPPMEQGENLEDPMALYLADANTTPVNLADLPAISVPIEGDQRRPPGRDAVRRAGVRREGDNSSR